MEYMKMTVLRRYNEWVLKCYAKYSITGRNPDNVLIMLNVSEETKQRILRVLDIIQICNSENNLKYKDFIENKAICIMTNIINNRLNRGATK